MIIVNGEVIKSAISLKIKNSLATGEPVVYPKIYKEAIAQGFVRPSFHIATIDVAQVRISKSSYERLYQMNVRYFIPQESDNLMETLEAMGNTLMGVLNEIEVPITDNGVDTTLPVYGIGMQYKVQDDVLQYFVNYKIKVTPLVAAGVAMETLTINQV